MTVLFEKKSDLKPEIQEKTEEQLTSEIEILMKEIKGEEGKEFDYENDVKNL